MYLYPQNTIHLLTEYTEETSSVALDLLTTHVSVVL